MAPKYSIVMTYCNRKDLLYRTLISIQRSSVFENNPEEVEVIIVDDGSDPEHIIDYLEDFELNIRLMRIEPAEKWWYNPCIPFNMGFWSAKGEIVVIQNAECLHYGDILQHVSQHLGENDYFSYACYYLNEKCTKLLKDDPEWNNILIDLVERPRKVWVNHSVQKPTYYHYTSAIYRDKLNELKGFNVKYARGIACDDIDFVHRLRKGGLDLQIIDQPFVIHQYHDAAHKSLDEKKYRELLKRNKKLMKQELRKYR